jgi:hypothetical protein
LRAIKIASGIEIIEAIKVEEIEILREVVTTSITSGSRLIINFKALSIASV